VDGSTLKAVLITVSSALALSNDVDLDARGLAGFWGRFLAQIMPIPARPTGEGSSRKEE
jgi:hypothetical protein